MQLVWRWLERERASNDLVDWSRAYGAEIERLWAECPRGDWLLALAARLGAERALLVRAACSCARLALAYLPGDEQRLAAALHAAEAYADDELTADACAVHRTRAAQVVASAIDASGCAAAVATQAALETIWDGEAAVNAAAFAAQAAVLDAGDCALLEALRFTQRKSAQCVRDVISPERAAALWQARSAAQPDAG